MKTAAEIIEKFMHDWGANLWAYFDKVGYYDKTDRGMRVELELLLRQHAIEFGTYMTNKMVSDENWDEIKTDQEFYSDWIKEQQ